MLDGNMSLLGFAICSFCGGAGFAITMYRVFVTRNEFTPIVNRVKVNEDHIYKMRGGS